jgi:hypothetical protein
LPTSIFSFALSLLDDGSIEMIELPAAPAPPHAPTPKPPTYTNLPILSDILTKALTGASFFRHRAAILGLAAATSDVGDSTASSSSAPLGVARAPTAEQSGPIRPHA